MFNIKKFDAGIRHLSFVSSYSEFEFKCIFVIFFGFCEGQYAGHYPHLNKKPIQSMCKLLYAVFDLFYSVTSPYTECVA